MEEGGRKKIDKVREREKRKMGDKERREIKNN